MSADRKYIVNYVVQWYKNNFPYSEIDKLAECDNIKEVKEITDLVFLVTCYKWSEDDLIKALKADQILYSDDGDNYFKLLTN